MNSFAPYDKSAASNGPRHSMIQRRQFLTMAAACAAGPAFSGVPAQGLPVSDVLELFTSQGCSACPPADRLFQTLSREPGILALSLPVTIWDHLGWKDTLAQTVFSERQKNYCGTRGDRQIYTPQAIVNGVTHALGSDPRAIDAARRDSRAQAGVMAVTPELTQTDGRWSVRLPASALRSAAVVLVSFQRSRVVEIGRGENNGRKITYGNVVRSITTVGQYDGTDLRLVLDAAVQASPADGFAILLQEGGDRHPGMICGAVESPRL